jgi:serine/threonine protein kinase
MHELEGQVVADKYHLVQFLSEGVFGQVFRAAHIAFELEMREVAIKIGKHPMSPREARQCFGDALIMARVARAASEEGLDRCFVTVFDAGICPAGTPGAGRPYIVMELVRGGSVRQSLKHGPFPLKRATDYFDEILKAVSFMHRGIKNAEAFVKPIVHRDIKPGNVLLQHTRDGRDVVKITDFGLAIEVDTLLGWTESGGDLAHLAPESFSHNLCSPQSDVYALGLLFYEMVTGRNPFAEVGSHLLGESEANYEELRRLHVDARQREQFTRLADHVELRKHPGVVGVIQKALTADMNTRPYKDAGDLRDAWRKAWRGQVDPKEGPRATVRRLTGEAEQRLGVGDTVSAMDLLHKAMTFNRAEIPDAQLVGQTYRLYVKGLLDQGSVEEAGRVALEGYRRRKCRSTCMAMADYYSRANSHLAPRYSKEGTDCGDLE